MLFSDITLIDARRGAQVRMYVGVRADRICYVGNAEPKEDFGSVYKGEGKLLLPGFYNAHAHSAMTLLRGYGENMKLDEWLNKRIFPFEARMSGEDIYAGTMLAMAESVRFGIVSSTDMYYRPDDVARAAAECGCKMNLSNSVLCFGDESLEELPAFGIIKGAYRDWHNAEGGRIKTDISVHAEYSSTERVWRGAAALAAEQGVNLHIHAAETRAEAEGCVQRHGKSVIEYLDSCGLLGRPATLAHCVWISESDMDVIKARGASVATCPASNMKLASGFANVPRMLDKGLNVALGTDGPSSNNNLNILEDAKLMALLAKGRWEDPSAVSPIQAIAAMTRAGAVSQGRDDCGLIEEGFKADLAVLDISGPNAVPVHSAESNFLYACSGSDVCLTMCDGRILYRDGEYCTMDVERVKAEASAAVKAVLARL